MRSRILFKAAAAERYIDFRLISRTCREHRHICVPRSSIVRLIQEDMVLDNRIHTLIALVKLERLDALNIIIYWPDAHGRPSEAGCDSIYIPYRSFMDFYGKSMQPDGPLVWRALDMDYFRQSRFVFEDREGLRQCLDNRLVRRKLIRYLRDNFYGGIGMSEYEIHFRRHPRPYSFTIQAVSAFPTYVQELVLENPQNMAAARYSMNRTRPEIRIPAIECRENHIISGCGKDGSRVLFDNQFRKEDEDDG